MDHYAKEADALYILGDFFESWIGDDYVDNFTASVCNKLHELSDRGKPIYFMVGNRDFLIGKSFADQCGMQLLKDPTTINLYQHRLLLTHGDALCTLDHAHQRFRKISQHPSVKNTFLLLPLFMRRKVAMLLRTNSKKKTHQLQSYIMDVTPDAVLKAFENSKAEFLIHGHTHQPAIHAYSGDRKRIVLGAWHEQGNMLVFYQDGDQQLVNF
jgi:UDP-2,3-diacylglucosamine hydrolase